MTTDPTHVKAALETAEAAITVEILQSPSSPTNYYYGEVRVFGVSVHATSDVERDRVQRSCDYYSRLLRKPFAAVILRAQAEVLRDAFDRAGNPEELWAIVMSDIADYRKDAEELKP